MVPVSLLGRRYGYHLPNGSNPTAPVPVVLVLHALGINAEIMEQSTGFSDLADKEGFIAVYPEGTQQANPLNPALPGTVQMWNSGGVFNIDGVDDVAFLSAVLVDLSTKANTNPKRNYVVGMSNGGMMAYRLAAEYSNGIAAMASVAGTISKTPWTPTSRGMPVLHIHGTNDGIVSYNAAEWHASVEDVMQTCSKFNQCNSTPTKGTPFPAVNPIPIEKWDYPVGPLGSEVTLYRVLGGGHTWPQQSNVPGLPTNLGPVSTSVNATQLIWDFLKKY
jgi:polyhydroxybutyrate depolymerase